MNDQKWTEEQQTEPAVVQSVWCTYFQTRSIDLRKFLVEQNYGLIFYVIRNAHFFAVPPMEAADLESYGAIGLIEAVERFDPGRGNRFSGFAYPFIAGRIEQGIACFCGCSRRKYRLEKQHRTSAVVRETPADVYGMQWAKPSSVNAETAAIKALERWEIRKKTSCLYPEEARIIRACFYREKTIQEICREEGMTRHFVMKYYHSALKHLQKLLTG